MSATRRRPRPGGRPLPPGGRAVAFLVAALGLPGPGAGAEDLYYRQDENGALVLTNVPDHLDLRRYPTRGSAPGFHSGKLYREAITRAALKNGVHPDLVYAVAAVESAFNPRAISSKGALGLMQLMPETATRFGVADAFNPDDNVMGGARYLRHLLDLFRGDLRLALAAYNAGENAVRAADGIPPYRETRQYVVKVLKLFGGDRKPYVDRGPRRSVAGAGAQTPIRTWTDADGVVHMTDGPPPAGTMDRPAQGPPR
jgi:hypothetical protein